MQLQRSSVNIAWVAALLGPVVAFAQTQAEQPMQRQAASEGMFAPWIWILVFAAIVAVMVWAAATGGRRGKRGTHT